MRSNTRLKKAIIISCIIFIVLTVISVLLIALNYFEVFEEKPVVTVKPNNTYTETLYVATDHDYKPFSYIEDGEYAGLDVELIAEVANRLKMNLELTLLDWNDAQKGLMDGTYDIILNMESNAILKDDRMIGTIPTDEKQYVVYGKNKISYVGELYGTRVAAYNKFDELGMDVITGYSYQEMFKMLLDDELDYVICPIQIGDSFIEALNAQKIIVSSYQVSYMYGCMALKAGDTELCQKLNEVIKTLQTEGFIEKIDKKWIRHRYGITTVRDIIQDNPVIIVLLVVGIQLLIFIIILLIFTSIHSQRQKAHAAELQEKLSIINEQNEELKIAHEKAQAASVAKTNFLFNMSHDLRTPMNAIIGFTNLAKRQTQGNAVLDDYLAKISVSSDLLLGLINDILEMAKIENGKAQLNPAPEDILRIMEQIDSVMHVRANEKKQELVFQHHVRHRSVLCDKLKLEQIMMNLLSNAIKYTEEQGHILVSLDEVDSSKEGTAAYIIKVKDDGIGMSEEFQSRIFESFEREKNTTVSKLAGTGLGMSITKNLIDLMGGEISLQSKLGEGSEFTVSLEFVITDGPVNNQPVDEQPVDEQPVDGQPVNGQPVNDGQSDASEGARQTDRSEGSAQEGARYHILVVDDNEINRMIATDLLDTMGYETDEACDGQEAVDKIRQADAGDYDIILMDIQMPVMNGYEATKAIRKLDSPLSSIPILAVTANAFDDDKKNAKDAGMNGHIAKPIDFELLEKTMNDILQHRERQEE